MKRFSLSILFCLSAIFLFAQDDSLGVKKNMVKGFGFSAGQGPFTFALGYERIISKYSIEMVVSLYGLNGDSEIGVFSVHPGLRYYLRKIKNKKLNNIYGTVFLKYQYIDANPDQAEDYTINGYGGGIGIGGILTIRKWLFVELGAFGLYAYGQSLENGKDGWYFLPTPRLLLGVNF